MRIFALLLLLVACGAPDVAEPTCPTTPSTDGHCCPDEIGVPVCLGHQAWVCEPAASPCTAAELAHGGVCESTHPERPVNRNVWFMNGGC